MRRRFSLGKASIAFKWARCIAYVLLFCGFFTGSGATAQAQTAIITLDAPGAGTNGSNSQGTYATGTNASGVITGYFYDSTFGSTLYGGCHGFIRNPDGTYITFDSPMSPADEPPSVPTCVQPSSINQAGMVAGWYRDPSFGCNSWPDTTGGCGGQHAFLRMRNGAFFKRRKNKESGVYRCVDGSAPERENAKRGLSGWLWAIGRLINRLLEEWYRQLLSWCYQIRGYAVVYDGHFLYDFTLDGIDGEKQSADKRIHRWLLERCYPRPHLTIYLDAPAEVLFARKGEKTLEELERRRQAFLQLRYRAKNFVLIDATRPFDVVHSEVSRLIEQGYRNSRARAVAG